MNSRLQKAYDFVKEKHKDQKRKFTGVDYITHLEDTAMLLWDSYDDAETDYFIAALLHDVVEDTTTDLKEVGQNFGKNVMDLVEELTSERNIKNKAEYLTYKMNRMSDTAFTIKLCDRLSNVMDLSDINVPASFTTQYVKETRDIMMHVDRKINDVQKSLLDRIQSMLLYLELNNV